MQRDRSIEFQTRLKILIRVIDRETSVNDHTAAIVTLARSIPGAEEELQALRDLRAEQIEKGHLTPTLGYRRDQLRKKVERKAKGFFTPTEMAQIHAAF